MTVRSVWRDALAAAVMVAAMASQAAGQSLQRAPASVAPETWRVLEPLTGPLTAADGQAGFLVVVRFDLLREAAALGGTIDVTLPTGEVARATIEWTSGADPSQTFVAGRLEGGVEGEVSLTVVDDTLAGRIVVNGRVFVVRRAPNSTLHVVTEVDQQQFPPDAEPLVPPPPRVGRAAVIPDQAAQADTNQLVDLLVVYTPAARAASGSTSSMVAEINSAVNNANVALSNAGVVHRLRLVHNAEVAYTEASPASTSTDLDRLTTNGDGFMDNVHALRVTFGADVVSLLYQGDVNAICGLAWVMGPSDVNNLFESSAFDVVRWNCASGNLSLAHEIGHNMGLSHDRANSTGLPAFPYAYGYAVAGAGRDVMATASCAPSCPRLAIFSTPLRNFPSTSTVAGVADFEDNARALDNTSLTVANFRQSVVCSYTLSATTGTIGPAGGTGTVGVTASSSFCAWAAASNAGFISVTGGASGTGSGTVTYSATALGSGTRSGTLTIAGQTFTLTQGPTMTLDHTTLGFGAINTNGTLSFITAAQTVQVSFAGATPLWTAVGTPTMPAWLQITGGSGATGNGSFTVGVVSGAGLPATGTLTATIQVAASGLVNSPQLITVRLTLFAATTTTAGPFGFFDTPAGGTVQGSIAVTGWALDDIEVDRVEIWRDLTTGETTVPFSGPGHPGNGKVFIANALFVPGARPDVEAAYVNNPLAYRAGWGYLLLTWGLWNQGNGAFTLYAFAFDKDGHAATLGSKSVTSSNGTATKPFGALDSPAYGQTVTASFWNYGWALTPKSSVTDPRTTCTIVDGNVLVGIDSNPLVPVTYGGARTDIAAAFAGFSNGSNAGGAYYIDITALANGTHSIGWYVVDDCGRADGIGSRFFTVAKSSVVAEGDAASDAAEEGGAGVADEGGGATDAGGTGAPDAGGVVAGPPVETGGVGDGVDVSLPPGGSSLDVRRVASNPPANAGSAGPGLRFMPANAGPTEPGLQAAAGSSLDVGRVLLDPPASAAASPMRMSIDTPLNGAAVEQPFAIVGWAIDSAAPDGPGVDSVHVWAYPTAPDAAPIFLGTATLEKSPPGGVATDAAALARSAFTLVAPALAPGSYDVVVSVQGVATASVDGAQTVRITVR